MSETICATNIPYYSGKLSCYTLADIVTIAKSLNGKLPEERKIRNISTKTKEALWREIEELTRNKCNYNQLCILHNYYQDLHNKKERIQKLKKYRFLPVFPETVFLWTSNIDDCMEQYERKYGDFIFLGASSSDFKPLVSRDTGASFIERVYNHGKKKIGIIYNLDPSDRPGSHWVGIFIDITPLYRSGQPIDINFYNSLGDKPSDDIDAWILAIAQNIGRIIPTKKIIVKINKSHHQPAGNQDCGFYAIHFVVSMLEGIPFEKFVAQDLSPAMLASVKRKYFRKKTQWD
jgi:hypothetical protein